ncbi:MAG: zinc-binding dehydrogenase [Desulfobacterales bacterium]
MKAAHFYGPGNIKVEEVDRPKLDPKGIILRVELCGICGTELHYYKLGQYGYEQTEWGQVLARPTIMGHEPSGEVVEVGSEVEGIELGMRVTVGGGGAFAEYMTVPRAVLGRSVFPLPDGMSWEVGAMVEIVGSAVRGVKRAEAEADDVVVVIGAGTLGQCVFQTFKAMRGNKVIVSAMGRKRIEVAKELGADIVIDAAEENAIDRVMEITKGRGADIVADCAGSTSSLTQASQIVRAGGFYGRRMRADGSPARPGDDPRFSIDGGKVMMMATYENDVPWQPTSFFFKDARIIAACGGPYGDALEEMAKAKGKINTAPLATHVFPLDKITEAFEMQANTDEAVKVMVKP